MIKTCGLGHKPWNGYYNPDLCDAGAMLHQLSHQANWEQGPVSQKSRDFSGAIRVK